MESKSSRDEETSKSRRKNKTKKQLVESKERREEEETRGSDKAALVESSGQSDSRPSTPPESYHPESEQTVKLKAFYNILQKNLNTLTLDKDGMYQVVPRPYDKPSVLVRCKRRLQEDLKKRYAESRKLEIKTVGCSGRLPAVCKYSDIFVRRPEQEREIKTVMMKGVAGVGKTLSVTMFVLQWAERTRNQDIELIFVLPFAELKDIREEEHCLHSLLSVFHPDLAKEDPAVYMDQRVLLIFDGFDQCMFPLDFLNNEPLTEVKKVVPIDVLLTNLIRKVLLPHSLIWITSRPAAATLFPHRALDLTLQISNNPKSGEKERYCESMVAILALPDANELRERLCEPAPENEEDQKGSKALEAIIEALNLKRSV